MNLETTSRWSSPVTDLPIDQSLMMKQTLSWTANHSSSSLWVWRLVQRLTRCERKSFLQFHTGQFYFSKKKKKKKNFCCVCCFFLVCFTMRHWLLNVYFLKLYLIGFFNCCFTVLRSLFNDFVLRGLWEKGRGHVYRTYIKSYSKYIKQLTPLTLTYIKTLAADKKSLEVALFFFILLLRWTDERPPFCAGLCVCVIHNYIDWKRLNKAGCFRHSTTHSQSSNIHALKLSAPSPSNLHWHAFICISWARHCFFF